MAMHRRLLRTAPIPHLSRLKPRAPTYTTTSIPRSASSPIQSLPKPALASQHLYLQTQRRSLHLAPPYLLDDAYTPRYHLLSDSAAAQKRAAAHAHLRNCNLCPRLCGVDRYTSRGACLVGAPHAKVSTVAPHFGEEPCIQGQHGSGSVFFSGCNLRCVFCQNHDIAHTGAGFDVTPEELATWMMKLQDVGKCHNINFVTPEHVVPQVVLAVLAAKEQGLRIPIVYNTSAFDSAASLELLDGIVDVYLPDFKVWSVEAGKRLLKAGEYAEEAKRTIKQMHEQVGDLCFTPDGLAKRGVLVRHLVMPGGEDEGRMIMGWLAQEVSRDLVVHVMEQYAPRAHVGKGRRGGKKLAKGGADAQAAREQVVEPGGTRPRLKDVEEVRYAEINRPTEEREVSSVRKAAENAGLWRFIEAARHGGFNI